MDKHIITGAEGTRIHELQNMVFALSDALADLEAVKLTSNRAKYYQKCLLRYAANATETAEKILTTEETNTRHKLGLPEPK